MRGGEAPLRPRVTRTAAPGGRVRLSVVAVSDDLIALLHLSEHDVSWLAQFFSLWVLPLAHEDLAIILGAYIVVNNIMPAGLVVLCIYGGMVASDFVLYGIGAGARHVPWLTRLAVDDRVRGFGDMLKRNLFGIVALCRVVPGVVFIAFVACGWTRVPLARFAMASLVTSALYLPLMLCIVIFFGNALDGRVGWWTWPFLLCVLFAIGFVRRQVFSFQETSNQTSNPVDAKRSPMAARNRGARAVGCPRKGPWAERIPRGLFYLPLVLSWIGFALRYRSLTLPTVANPRHPTGRAWGGSRSGFLLDVAGQERRWIADVVVIARSAAPRTLSADLEYARQSLRSAGLAFPLIAKPDVGRHGASRIDDVAALREYLRNFPGGEKLILQAFVPHENKAAVLYARLPGAQSGRILSLTFRVDGLCRDARRHITPELEARIDAVARNMREFHYGCFELRVASADDLMRGENFSIVAINGIGSAADHAWDPALPLGEVYRRLVDNQRIMFLIGETNRARGFEPLRCTDVLKFLFRQNQIGRRYPASA
jgi:membrane protein DedA with SNARE-associated domain